MIKKITELKNFGIFQEFSWRNDLQEFNKYNFIFGWNGSGKSTISRLFNCIEKKQFCNDFINSEFEIETNSTINNKITQKNIQQSNILIKVFNENFIEENFDWKNENKEIEPILILGKEIKELNEVLSKKQKEKVEIEKNKNDKEKDKINKENELVKLLTSKASEIRNILGITNPKEFDKNKLEEKVRNSKDFQILTEEELINHKNKYTSKKLDTIEPLNFDFKLNEFQEKIDAILEKKINSKKIIEAFIENSELSDWVYKGISLHKDKETCQFCGNPLKKERLEEINNHFSKEYDNFINEINELQENIVQYKDKLEKFQFPDKARFYDELQNKYSQKTKDFEINKQKFLEILNSLIKELNRKKEKVFEEVQLNIQINEKLEEETKKDIDEIDNIIESHNKISENIEHEKIKSKELMIQHYVKDFYDNSDYKQIKNKIEELQQEINVLNNQAEELEKEIKDIEKQIEAESIGADKINEVFKNFFGDDRLKVQKTVNGKYKLYRDNIIAKNLSTGERNIISLIYFFMKLEETNFNKNEAIIFIDDPVSSLDYNYMYRVYAYLSNKISEFKQTFVTTHNFEFLNLLKDMNRYDLQNKECNFYLVKRVKNQNRDFSAIENLPNILLKFKSEYNYLFSIIKEFKKINDKSNYEQLYILPNILRRFLELYLHTKYPDGSKYKDKAEKFFSSIDKTKIKSFLKFIDEHSHEENLHHAFTLPDINEITELVETLLTALENKDKEHYDALCNSINVKNS